MTDSVTILPFPGQKLRELVSPKLVEQKPNVQPVYSFNEPKTPKTTTQPVGALNTKNPSIKELLNPKNAKEVGGENSTTDSKQNQPLELENLLMHWKKYAHRLKEENKASIFPILTKRDPKIINDNTVLYEVDSDWVKDYLTPELHELLAYMKLNLNNSSLSVQIKVLEEGKQVVNPYSPQEKFKILSEKNPNLQMLQRMFNLDVDY